MNENENKITETTFTEAIVTGWQHPFRAECYVNKYEAVAASVGTIKIVLAYVAIVAIIFMWSFDKMAKNQDVQIKDKETGKWCFWNKALKKWLPKD